MISMQSRLIYRGSLTERILDLLWQMSGHHYIKILNCMCMRNEMWGVTGAGLEL